MIGAPPRPFARNLWTLALYTAVAVVFTWPLAADPLGRHVSLHFDHYGVMWASAAIDTVDLGLQTDASNWPLGKSLLRADSFVLLGLARVLGMFGLAGLAGPLCALAGPVLSAWAAERVSARTFGAAWPWSILAGLAYGFSGLGMTVLLEGHDYALLDPWLPLLAERVTRAAGPEGRVRDGLLAGVYWALALLTTAYVGVGATLLAGALLARGLWSRTARPGPLFAAASVVLPIALAYALAFAADGSAARLASDTTRAPRVLMEGGSARLGTLLSWSPSVDLSGHSVAPSLGLTAVVLALVAPRVLRGRPGWRVLLGGAVVTVVLSLGPRLQLAAQDIDLPWVLAPLTELPGATLFRFPARLLWIASLGFGLVAARVATRLAEISPRVAPLLLVFGLVDIVVATGAPFRTVSVPTSAPSAYAVAPRGWALLEVYPPFYGALRDLDVYLGNVTCSYRAGLFRPVMHDCLTTTLRSSPGHVLKSWLVDHALEVGIDSTDLVHGELVGLGVGAVALHPDLYARPDRIAVTTGFARLLGEPAAESVDAGEHVVVWALVAPDAAAPDRDAAVARWRAFQEGT